MTEHILMTCPKLYEVRSDYALTRVCGRTITVMLLRLRTAVVLAFSLTRRLLSKNIHNGCKTSDGSAEGGLLGRVPPAVEFCVSEGPAMATVAALDAGPVAGPILFMHNLQAGGHEHI